MIFQEIKNADGFENETGISNFVWQFKQILSVYYLLAIITS